MHEYYQKSTSSFLEKEITKQLKIFLLAEILSQISCEYENYIFQKYHAHGARLI